MICYIETFRIFAAGLQFVAIVSGVAKVMIENSPAARMVGIPVSIGGWREVLGLV